MKSGRLRRLCRLLLVGVVLFVVLGVWITHQFPGLTERRKTSLELLEDLFRIPFQMVEDPARVVLSRAKREAAEVFIKSTDLPDDVETRLVDLIHQRRFREVTVPFVSYLYDLYGAPVGADAQALASLRYDEPPAAVADETGDESAGLSALLQQSRVIKKHVRTALRLYDALFLRMPTLPEELDEAAVGDLKTIIREIAREFLPESDDALSRDIEENQYAAALQELLEDDERLRAFSECFADFIRGLSDSWLRSFLRREGRKEERLAWVQKCLVENRYHAIADYAGARARRGLVLHLAVDGLEGKLLEGLAQLSSGDRSGSGARYVIDLVRQHRLPNGDLGDPQRREDGFPPPLGDDIQELATSAPDRPEYLESFKKYFFSADARSVVVNVATVDTPTISVRNLPVIFSGHGVAGRFGTGIPNFSYLDRRTGRGWYFWGSDVMHMRRIFGNREDEIPHGRKRPEGPGARTLFERLWRYNTVSCMATVDTGAVEKISSEVGVAVGEVQRNFIEKVIVLRFRQRAEMERELNRRRRWLMEHRHLTDSFLGSLVWDAMDLKTFREHAEFLALHEDEGLPDYVLWYNPWPDHFAHYEGPYSDAIIGYRGEYDRLDFFFGKMMEVYESVETVDGQSTYADRTLVGVVGDHGLVYTPEVVSADELLLDAMRRDGKAVTSRKLTVDEGGLPAIRGRDTIESTRPFDVVVGSTAGGSYILDLFDIDGLQGDDAAWQRHPDYHRLRSHRLLSGQSVDWIEEISGRLRGVMDVALVREYGPSPDESWPEDVKSVVRIVTPDRGEARILRVAGTGGGTLYRYEILGETDPLDLVGSFREFLVPSGGPSPEDALESLERCIDSPTGCDDDAWITVLSFTLRPDVVHQYSHLYDTDRAGTINVFPLRHVGMNSAVPGRHAGEAFGEKNGAQLYCGAGLNGSRVQTARNGSVPVTLYHWLVGDETFRAPESDHGVSPAEQFGFPSLLEHPAFEATR